MAFESIKGAEDDENEYLIADARREKERERVRKNNRYYRRKYSDEELPAVRINHLNTIRRTKNNKM